MFCWRITAIFLLIALLVLTACGGSAVNPDPGPGDGDNLNPPPTGQWTGTAGTGAAADPGFTGVPEIPFDGFTVSRVSSEAVVLELPGSQYLQKYNAEVDGTSLVLAAPDAPEEGGFPIAYGLYRFSGLQDVQLQWLNIECMPRVFGESYYVGLADYTIADWLWFGPVTFPEFQLDLRDLNDRVVTELGNMYFIVVCEGGNGATLSKSSLTIETGGEDEGLLPGAPHHLAATDGAYENYVVIEWEPGIGAGHYELWRAGSEEGDWDDLAVLEGTRYEDLEVIPGQLYWYKAYAVNEHGRSGHSNIDEGYAGVLGEDPGVPSPFDLVASDGNYPDKVRVEWEYEGDYGYFQLWRKVNEEGYEWHKIADTEAKEYNDFEVEPGVVYVYKARAIRGDQESDWSNHDTGYCCEGGGGLEPPWDLVASDGTYTDKVRVEWMYEGDYGYFDLWRKKDAEGHEWQRIATPEVPEYNDYEVLPGYTYIYKVRAIIGEQESDWSNHDTGYCCEGGGIEPPWELAASDGAYADKVFVEWGYEGDYGYFQVWRRIAEGEHEWGLLGSTEAKHYQDFTAEPGVVYAYKARAIIGEQESEFSNHDTGYRGGEPSGCAIEVIVRNGEGHPIAGVGVVLYGLETPVVHETDEAGETRFFELPHGLYLVVPVHHELAFEPAWELVDLRELSTGVADFTGVPTEGNLHRLWGVVYSFNGEHAPNQFTPLSDILVRIHLIGSEEYWDVYTNDAGYWEKPELPGGTYTITPMSEGYEFSPGMHDAVINGEQVPERLDFRGYPY